MKSKLVLLLCAPCLAVLLFSCASMGGQASSTAQMPGESDKAGAEPDRHGDRLIPQPQREKKRVITAAPREKGADIPPLPKNTAKPLSPAPTRHAPKVPPPHREIKPIPEKIMGSGSVDAEALAEFLLQNNPYADWGNVYTIALYYKEECAAEGVNSDVAFAQMCVETGFLKFGNLVTADMYNFAGLGSIGPGKPGERFETPRIGVRAHVQHLKAYATDEKPKRDLVDTRYRYVRYGSAPTIDGLSGTWAADKNYAAKIRGVLTRLYNMAL